jgi:hypothetical protein
MGELIKFPKAVQKENKFKNVPSFSKILPEIQTPIPASKSLLQCDAIDSSKNNALLLFKSESLKDQLCVGPWEFSCPKCKTRTKFDCTNMVFKMLEFYCSICGSYFKVVNPAFSNK